MLPSCFMQKGQMNLNDARIVAIVVEHAMQLITEKKLLSQSLRV